MCAGAASQSLYQSFLKGFEDFQPVQAMPTLASAIQIGHPVSVQKAIATLKRFDGVVEQATEDELANAAAWSDRTGLFNCPHTGVALAALFKLAQRGEVRKDDRVVVISTASGLKFPEFKIRYHESRLADVTHRHTNLPVDLPATYDAVREAILPRFDTQPAQSR